MVTQTQELLLDGLRAFRVEKDLIIGIMVMLKSTKALKKVVK